uniref:Hydroxyproline-rich glycoprotein family protein n=1 Tax=Kalanchoe fedtschenkoi TaxID=63787 RepID=A0A7N0ZWY8_KALFE
MVRSSTKGVITKDQILMDREAPDLSGVYMRSLVKKMSSSKVRNPDGFCQGASLVKVGQGSSDPNNPQNQQPSPQQHKKKVRRRLHTSRPYQERLLNMAEARREIVTALKFHRASMKQQQQQQQEQPLHLAQPPPLQILSHGSPDLNAKVEMDSGNRPTIYPCDGGLTYPSSVDNFYQSPSFTCASSNHMLNSNAPPAASVSCYPNSSFRFPLPNQTLGLNLNFNDFGNLSTSAFQSNPSLFTSPSSSSSSPALSSTTTDEIHSAAEDSHNGAFFVSQPDNNMAPYSAMDSEVMKEIKSMGDCHDMVWNDTMNLVTSAWWFKFSKAAETSAEELKEGEDDHLFTELTELPSWLNPTDCFLQQHLSTACPEDSSPDPALPCMDIGEIEGMDGDWLA